MLKQIDMTSNNIKVLFLAAALCALCCSCGKNETRSKVMLNEVLVDNQNNFQDDYGQNGPWIEIFNRTYGSVDLAGYYLKHSCQPGDTTVYFIPKGDIQTQVKSHQHALFWADGQPKRGTFHTSFKLDPEKDNWIGLYDSGRKLLDQVVVPGGALQADCSYARVSDAGADWEIKDGSEDKYVTPSTNNKTIDSSPKMEKFALHDKIGVGMAVTAMCVVFCGLLLLFIVFRIVSNVSVNLSKRNAIKAKGIDKASAL